jgi:hypothetical protein
MKLLLISTTRNQWHVDLRQLGHAPRESGACEDPARSSSARRADRSDHPESRRIDHCRLRTLELRQRCDTRAASHRNPDAHLELTGLHLLN